MRRVITLDGPAGVGKSTLAKRVAELLGVAYLDTGAMFRSIALSLGAASLDLPPERLAIELEKLHFSLSGTGAATTLACNGIPAGREIRTEEVGMLASRFATLPVVRAYLKKAQRELGAAHSLVAEGRDMGTAVFPDAHRKFFLDASPETRAERRVRQLAESGITEDIAAVASRIRERDEMDRNRAIAPLIPARDAIVIDTSGLDIHSVLDAILREI